MHLVAVNTHGVGLFKVAIATNCNDIIIMHSLALQEMPMRSGALLSCGLKSWNEQLNATCRRMWVASLAARPSSSSRK